MMENFGFVDGRFVHQKFLCTCGKEHDVPIREILVKPGALHEIAQVLDRLAIGKKCLVIADLNTYEVAGETVMDELNRTTYAPKLCLFDTRELVKPDERALGKVLLDLDLDTSFLLVVGSGSLTDLTRYISSRTKLPFVSVATAASMDGYASTGAPMLKGGFKLTIESTYPSAIIADVDVICQAPYPMTTAGFGDLLGKLNCSVDWKLGQIVTGEYYCDFVVNLVNDTVNMCVENAQEIQRRTPDVMAKLVEGLILSGIAMLVVGNSRPASGAEHHLSHYWEMKAFLENRPQHFHGTKVGVATGIMAKFYEKFFSRNPADIDLADIERRKPSLEEWKASVKACFGPIADGILVNSDALYLDWEEQKKQIARIQSSWEQIQALHTLEPSFERVVEIQKAVGGSISPKDIDVDSELLRETLLNAKDIRSRYTVLRVADILGWLEEITDEVVNELESF